MEASCWYRYVAFLACLQGFGVRGMTCVDDGKQHDMRVGLPSWNETLIYQTVVKESASVFSKSVDVDYPPAGGPPQIYGGPWKISRIEVTDMSPKGTGGCGYVAKGGVGETFVMLRFKSQRGKTMYFAVRLFSIEAVIRE